LREILVPGRESTAQEFDGASIGAREAHVDPAVSGR
jgi:hypothetical protein